MMTLLYGRECMYLHKSVLQRALSGACKNTWANPLRLGVPLVPLRLGQVFKKMLEPVLATRFVL